MRCSPKNLRIITGLRATWMSVVVASAAQLLLTVPVWATDAKDEVDYPLAVFNAASYDRLHACADLMFQTAERSDMMERVDQWTTNGLKETKGIDRGRPFGMMLYMRDDMAGVMGISYLPVADLDEALDTLAYGVGTISPVEDKPGRYNILYPRQDQEEFKLRALFSNGYLFMAGPDGNDTSLDRNFPNPERLTSRLTAQYDLAASLLISTIPAGLKTTVLAVFVAQSKALLQQRDEEPESEYRLRRASGEGWIELIEKIVKEGKEFTLGGRIDPESHEAFIDLEVAGTRDSKLAKLFQNMAGKRTDFGNLLENPSTFTMSVSWLTDEKQRKLMATYLDAAHRDFSAGATTGDAAAELSTLLDPIFKTLAVTADVGHLDAIAQLTGTDQGEFALVGAVKVATSRDLPQQLKQALEFLKEHPNGNDILESLELEVETIDSYPVHRLPADLPPGPQRLFGENANVYLHANAQAVWFALGGESALETLKDSLQTVAHPQSVKQNRNRVPFQFITHAKNWLAVADDSDPDAALFNERARTSFESDTDALTMEFRPTDSGVRLRLHFQSGFVGLMGRGFTNGIENGFEGRRAREERLKRQKKPAEDAPASTEEK